MVSLFKLHKFAGLSAGLVLFILGLTGFLLDHDKWGFLYTTTLKHFPQSVAKIEGKLFDSYYINPDDSSFRLVGGKRGLFQSKDSGKSFEKLLDIQCLSIKKDTSGLYLGTSDGIYKQVKSKWENIALKDEYITSLSLSEDIIVAVIDKHELVQIKKSDFSIISKNVVEIEEEKLIHDIKLSRFVRDLHYGRGLFDGDISLLINDYGALYIVLLSLSGYIIWWFIHKKIYAKLTRKLIRIHATIFAVLALIPLVILSITGIFLDHSTSLRSFMSSVTIPNEVLPPVYRTLEHDIWSVDFDGKIYRIGNRYGIYKSEDLKIWDLENKGLAYRMIRHENILYVSGMGAPNRIYENGWKILPKTPHMFRDVVHIADEKKYFAMHKNTLEVPKFNDVTLYSLVLSLHDGTFFSPLWIWINDYVSIALILLGITGTLRWLKRKRAK